MKIALFPAALLGVAVVFSMQAQAKELTPQQRRMADCNERATAQSVKGEARKAWMSNCLKKTGTPDDKKGLTPQQQKMRECNAQATQQSLKGEDRKKLMSACLKKQV